MQKRHHHPLFKDGPEPSAATHGTDADGNDSDADVIDSGPLQETLSLEPHRYWTSSGRNSNPLREEAPDSSLTGQVAAADKIRRAFETSSSSPARREPSIDLRSDGSRPTSPTIVESIKPAMFTEYYEHYWRFAAERQEIFFRRFDGRPWPWTEDPILDTYKFTNVYRASDRVSQFLIRNVIYADNSPSSAQETVFRILLFKLFNKIETWQLLERRLGQITYADFCYERYDNILTEALLSGQRIYSAAYIMPPGRHSNRIDKKHQHHLLLLEEMLNGGVHERLAEADSMQDGFDILRNYPTIGSFLAYQYIIDINYSEVVDFSEMDFVVPGPGARRGLRRCFRENNGLSDSDLIKFITFEQEREFERLGLRFRSLWGRPLQLIDCQNILCEFDKYSRVAFPDCARVNGSRIKQKFRATNSKIGWFYPPKWKLNDRIQAWINDEFPRRDAVVSAPSMLRPSSRFDGES